jgi:hypothetical protein
MRRPARSARSLSTTTFETTDVRQPFDRELGVPPVTFVQPPTGQRPDFEPI